jgi:di/tricarboxylate transporter
MSCIFLLSSMPGLPAVLTPLAGTLAEASGLPLQAVLLTQILAFSTIIFPYQGAPLVFAFYAGGVPFRTAVLVMVMVTIGSALVIVPATYVWWRFMGVIP